MAHKILLIEDNASVRKLVRKFLEGSGFEVREATTVQQAADTCARERPDAVLLDFELPDGTALEVLPRLKEVAPTTPVVILTGHGSIERAVQSVKRGAEDFLTKPIELGDLARTLDGLLADREPRAPTPELDPFLGDSPAVRELEREALLTVRSDSPVLIRGETGTGKGVLARWIHTHGPRADGKLVALNCGGLARELLQSELFGHARGAFTDAVRDKTGLIEEAAGGSLFLDEIGDMDLDLQPKLLTVLDDRIYRRLGEVRERETDLRLIAATNRELGELVREGDFRADLYFRVSTLSIHVPALRERRGDLPELVRVTLDNLRSGEEWEISDDALEALGSHDWPGNFRELRGVLERATLAADGHRIERSDLRFDPLHAGRPSRAEVSLADAEHQHIEAVLRAERGHVTRTARRLGVARSTLYEKLKALDLDPADYRSLPEDASG